MYNVEVKGDHYLQTGQQGMLVRNSKILPGDAGTRTTVNISTMDRVALGPFGSRNEQSFWMALVEGKKLHHLGFRKGVSALRDSLALGETVFRGAPDGLALFKFIED